MDPSILLERHYNMRLGPLDPPIRNLIRRMPTTFIEPASHHPNQHRNLLTTDRRHSRRPDVQVQTVLGLGICVLEFRYKGPKDSRSVVAVLDADRLVGRCGVWTTGLIGSFDGGLEAQVRDRRSAKGNAVPLVDLGEGGVYEASISTARGIYGEQRGSCVVRTRLTLGECASQQGEEYV
jgi:hypothetical protein